MITIQAVWISLLARWLLAGGAFGTASAHLDDTKREAAEQQMPARKNDAIDVGGHGDLHRHDGHRIIRAASSKQMSEAILARDGKLQINTSSANNTLQTDSLKPSADNNFAPSAERMLPTNVRTPGSDSMLHAPTPSAEDEGIAILGLLLASLSEYSWATLCLLGMVCVLLFIHHVKLHTDEGMEDLNVYQTLPLATLWSLLGIALILFNKCIYMKSRSPDIAASLGFDFPHAIFLMWFQMLCITGFAHILRISRPDMMPVLTSGKLKSGTYIFTVLPVACLQAVSLSLGNMAYLYISVSYIQMVKNTTSAFVFTFSVILGLEALTLSKAAAVALVVLGLLLSSIGDLHFSLMGFILQISSTLSDSLRLCLTKSLMSSKFAVKLDPMSTLCVSSSSMCLLLMVPMCFIDLPHMTFASVWQLKFVLLANAVLALGLNMTSMFWMKRSGVTTYALVGVIKDIFLVLSLLTLFGHRLAWLQAVGFGLSIAGFQLYNKLKSG